MPADVVITEYTDPGCPWAFSAEPFRRRIDWLYGAHVEWASRMVVLSDSPDDYIEKGFTPEKQGSAFATMARMHRMPIDTSVRPRMTTTAPACRAVVAARVHSLGHAAGLLRCLRVSHFEGDSQVRWFEGNFEAYEEHRRALLGDEADRPHRITYKRLTRT